MWGRDRGGDSTVETWTALTYLAAKTEKIRLGTLVTPIPFRPPGMLAKTVSTLDLLSNGRTILGVGAGWSRTEFEGYSKWNSNKIRVDKTREGLDLILKLWTQEKVDFKGKFYHANGAVLEPKPVQKPHPPLLFGQEMIRSRWIRDRRASYPFEVAWVFDRREESISGIMKKLEEEEIGRAHV